jgi:hypothetical protein
LGSQQTVQVGRDISADAVESVGHNAKGDTATQVHEAGNDRQWRRLGSQRRQPPSDFTFGARRQRMEHGQVSGQLVSFRRIMAPPEPIEPGEVRVAQFRGDNQRAGHESRSNCSSCSNWAFRNSTRMTSPSIRAAAQGNRLSVSPTPATPPSETAT